MRTLIFRTIAPGLTSLMLLFSAFVLLRGHNDPGGGFIGGLIAVAAMGSLAAWVYANALDGNATPGVPGFGEPVPAGLAPALDAARLAASDAAFSAISLVTALLCLLSAVIAWTTISGQPLPWPRRAQNPQG